MSKVMIIHDVKVLIPPLHVEVVRDVFYEEELLGAGHLFYRLNPVTNEWEYITYQVGERPDLYASSVELYKLWKGWTIRAKKCVVISKADDTIGKVPITSEWLEDKGFKSSGISDFDIEDNLFRKCIENVPKLELMDSEDGSFIPTVNCGHYRIGRPLYYTYEVEQLYELLTGEEL